MRRADDATCGGCWQPAAPLLYTVRAINSAGTGPESTPDAGLRGVGDRFYSLTRVANGNRYAGSGVSEEFVATSAVADFTVDVPTNGTLQRISVVARAPGGDMIGTGIGPFVSPECDEDADCADGQWCNRAQCAERGFARIDRWYGAFGRQEWRGAGADEKPWVAQIAQEIEIQTTEVRQRDWARVMDGFPSHFEYCGLDCPVENVSFNSVLEYANRLSASAGLTACYVFPEGCTGNAANGTLLCDQPVALEAGVGSPYGCEGYRLPTEVEWEVVARNLEGPSGQFAEVTEIDCDVADPVLRQVAFYCDNSVASYAGCERLPTAPHGTPDCRGPRPVATLEPNLFGTYDMLGNVAEWVWDGYGELVGLPGYATSRNRAVNPAGAGPWMERGGSYADLPADTTVSSRRRVDSAAGSPTRGFRRARTL